MHILQYLEEEFHGHLRLQSKDLFVINAENRTIKIFFAGYSGRCYPFLLYPLASDLPDVEDEVFVKCNRDASDISNLTHR